MGWYSNPIQTKFSVLNAAGVEVKWSEKQIGCTAEIIVSAMLYVTGKLIGITVTVMGAPDLWWHNAWNALEGYALSSNNSNGEQNQQSL